MLPFYEIMQEHRKIITKIKRVDQQDRDNCGRWRDLCFCLLSDLGEKSQFNAFNVETQLYVSVLSPNFSVCTTYFFCVFFCRSCDVLYSMQSHIVEKHWLSFPFFLNLDFHKEYALEWHQVS